MRRFTVQFFGAILLLVAVEFCLINFVPAPIAAEYWVREMIVVKRSLVRPLTSPRIIFLGGSSTLFGFDASQVQNALGLPAMNLGLHGGMRLDWLLSLGEEIARPGDIFVLPLEHPYYSCEEETWSGWQLRNSLAWHRAYFDSLPPAARTWTTFAAADFPLVLDVATSRLGSIIFPKLYSRRIDALAPDTDILTRYDSGSMRTDNFAYSAYNIDRLGDILNTNGARFSGDAAPTDQPGKICPSALLALRNFVNTMKQRDVRAIIAHEPFLIEGRPVASWRAAEVDFVHDVGSTGAELLDERQEVFFPRSYFFNTNEHLNDIGRRERTTIAIADLKKLFSQDKLSPERARMGSSN